MIIRDNLSWISVDQEMSKMPILIGPELQCLQVSYFLQEVSDTTNSEATFSIWAFWILEACKTYCAIKSAFWN